MLDEIHQEAPDATFFLIFRPIDDWIRSITAWDSMRERIATCDLPMKPSGVGLTDEELREFVCRHVMHVREFVQHHPTHRLIELNLYEDNSQLLREIFPSDTPRKHRCWGRKNANKKLNPEKKDGQRPERKIMRSSKNEIRYARG